MAGMEPQTPDEIARGAGFATSSNPTPAVQNIPRNLLAPTPVAPFKAPSVGTTEIVPGAFDWVKSLVMSLVPTQSAQAAGMAPPPTMGVPPAAVNGAFPAGQGFKAPPSLSDRLWKPQPISYEGGVRG